jgi:glycosyltransferase involved in cell wall biosynthesis
MKVLFAHNLYQQPGGEDVVVLQEMQMLRDAGHQVVLYQRSNDEAESYKGVKRVNLFAHTVWSSDTRKQFEELLRRERPDMVHVHNTFLMISPSIFQACKNAGVPVVQTLHNYRLYCPAHNFLRNGLPCEDCVTSSLFSSIRHRCYRGSVGATAAVATMLGFNHARGTYTNEVDRYIALTEFARAKFIECGLPTEKVVVKPNFVYSDPGERHTMGTWAVFMGRLTPEKGLATALSAWSQLPPQMELKIIGDGPSLSELHAVAKNSGLRNVSFLGRLPREQAFEYLAGARFLLFPSEWYESFPMTILEAYAHGLPVLASRMGVMPEIVKENQTGLLFEPRSSASLAQIVRGIWDRTDLLHTLSQNARTEYEKLYTVDQNYRQLIAIYEDVIETRDRVPGAAAA